MENIKKSQNKYINPSLVSGTIKQSKSFLIIFTSIVIGFLFLSCLMFLILQNTNSNMIVVLELKKLNILQYYINDNTSNLKIMGLIFTGIVAMAALLKEENKGTTEFLFAHPISRKKMFFTQMISFVSILTIFSLGIMTASFIIIIAFNGLKFDFNVGQYFIFHAVLFLTNIIYGFFMYGLASVLKGKNYHAPAICIGIIIALVSVLVAALGAYLYDVAPWVEKFNYLFVTSILNISSLLSKGVTVVWQPIVLWSFAAIALNVWGYFRYQKKDLNCA